MPRQVYGLEYVRPQHHAALHIPEIVRRLGYCPNAFVFERRHSDIRRRAGSIFAHFEAA